MIAAPFPPAARSVVPAFALLALASLLSPLSHADDWPQWRGPNRDGAWNETGILETFPAGGLKIAWRAKVGFGFSSPVVARGRVYVTDSQITRPKAHERVQCFDAKTGAVVWTHSYEVDYPEWAFDPKNGLGPRATPIIAGDRLYALGAKGRLFCFDAAKGQVIWEKELALKSKDAAFTPSPLIEDNLLILFLDGSPPGPCVVALDKDTGREVWRAMEEAPTFSSPIVLTAAGKRQLIVWAEGAVHALDPATGRSYWRERCPGGTTYAIPSPVAQDDLLLVNGTMFKLDADKPGATVLWPEGKPASRQTVSDTSTPILRAGHIFTCNLAGELVCLEAKTGRLVWTSKQATEPGGGASLHLTPNGKSVLIFNDQGQLIRADLTAAGYREISRSPLLRPTQPFGNRSRAWTPPAFAAGSVFARSDEELICASLTEKP
jgi:outer membrane protein assembly factor BamB